MDDLEHKIIKSLEREGDIVVGFGIASFIIIVGFLIYAIIW